VSEPVVRARLDRVCVVMMSAMGNVVHVLPALNALKRHHPAARVSWILQPLPASLVRGHPAVDEIIVYQRKRRLEGLLELRRDLARREFDLVLDFQVYLKAGLVTRFTRAPVKLGFDRRRAKELNWLFTTHRLPPRPPAHRQEQFLEFLDALGIPRGEPEWKLGPWPHERPAQRELMGRFDRPVVPLVVAGTREGMSWVDERWAELVDVLYEDFGLQPVLVGGRSAREQETERVIAERAGHRPVSMLGCDVREMVALLDAAALVVSVDTGPLHMAVALGTPVVSLLGYFNPKHTGPVRFRELMVDAYGDPGEDYPLDDSRRDGRMERIRVEEVVEKVALARRLYPGSTPGGQASP
jgi:heptosyltransferase I